MMKLKKGDYLYKENDALALIYKINNGNSNGAVGTIVWSKGDTMHWREGMSICNISGSPDEFFTIVKKISKAEYFAKVI